MVTRPFSSAGLVEPGGTRQQGLSLEVPVTVEGLPGTGSAEAPAFCEDTRTVIVFAQGCVARLKASARPGQRVILTHARSRKEIICRVAPPRTGFSSGYVELEFTQALNDFWGITFPGERPGRSEAAPAPAARVQAPPVLPKPIEAHRHRTELRSSALDEHLRAAPAVSPLGQPQPPAASGTVPLPEPIAAHRHRTELRASVLDEHLKAAPSVSPLAQPPLAPRTEPAPLAEPQRHRVDPPAKPAAAPVSTVAEPRKSAPVAVPAPPAAVPAPKTVARPVPRFEPAAATPAADLAPIELPKFEGLLLNPQLQRSSRKRARGRVLAAAAVVVFAVGGGFAVFFANPAEGLDLRFAPPAPPADASVATTPATEPPAAAGVAAPAPTADQTAAVASVPDAAVQTPANGAVNPGQPAAVTSSATTPTATPANPDAGDPARRKPLHSTRIAAPIVSSSSDAQPISAPDAVMEPPAAAAAGALPSLTAPSSPAAPKEPVRVGGNIVMPKLRASVAPLYPPLARQGRIQGDVVIEATIEATGRVGAMKVVSGHAMLQQAALNALQQWRYEPAVLNGQPVAVQLTVTIQFRL